jgi:dihydrofolate synthase/folylpolyglutamate synthase
LPCRSAPCCYEARGEIRCGSEDAVASFRKPRARHRLRRPPRCGLGGAPTIQPCRAACPTGSSTSSASTRSPSTWAWNACAKSRCACNGKGSTVAFLEAIARAAGWKVGAYTSPHLLAYNERVRIDGRDAADGELVAAFEAVEAARVLRQAEGERGIPLTYFEFGTLAALWLFERAGLDLAILEVGLGGRLDATNLVDPDVAVITTVDLDHQDWLGGDRESIGREKAGIARPWKPLVLGEDDPPASVLRHAYAIGAPAIRAGCDFLFERTGEQSWRWREPGFSLDLPLPALAAPARAATVQGATMQIRNAATAIAALRALREPVETEVYAEGIRGARIAARLQGFDRAGVQVLVDVGHNPQAARQLADALVSAPAAGRTLALYAALSDKAHAEVVSALAPAVDAWCLAGTREAGPRGMAAEVLAGRLAGTAAAGAACHDDVAVALQAALAQSGPGDRVLVFGSFHTAAAALRLLNGA